MTESAKRLKNYFDYDEWDNESYDQLLIHLYRKFNSDELKKSSCQNSLRKSNFCNHFFLQKKKKVRTIGTVLLTKKHYFFTG